MFYARPERCDDVEELERLLKELEARPLPVRPRRPGSVFMGNFVEQRTSVREDLYREGLVEDDGPWKTRLTTNGKRTFLTALAIVRPDLSGESVWLSRRFGRKVSLGPPRRPERLG